MQIYDDNGYVDIRKILSYNLPFTIVVGGRATGKTYTTLKTVVEDHITFMYMRRLQSQCDLINKPEFSPFKTLNNDMHWRISTTSISKYNAGFYNFVLNDEGDKYVPDGLPLGYTCALSTISNMRGFDASDVKLLIYDEFIHEKHERDLKNEGDAFLNAYETMNRNRELKGQKPLQCILLANSTNMANPIFMSLGLVRVAQRMKKIGNTVYINNKRGIGIFMLDDSPISKQKAETVLYKLTEDSEFSRMSLGNEFATEEIGRVKSQELRAYKPFVAVGELCIYKHKSSNLYYCSTHKSGNPEAYGTGSTELARFRKKYYWLWQREYMENNIIFEEYVCQILFEEYFK